MKALITAYILTTSSALIVLKLGSSSGSLIQFTDNKLAFNLTLYSVLGIFLYGVSFLLYTYLISKYDLGYIIPLTTAFVYILIFTASAGIFKESFTTLKVIGIALILAGVVLLNTKSSV